MNDNSDKILASVGAKSNTLVFRLGEYQGTRIFDIRKYFYDERNDTFSPTRKGITLSKTTYATLQKILTENKDEISDWFAKKNGTFETVRREQEKQENAANDARFQPNDYERKGDRWKDQKFFEKEAHGGKDILTYNFSHPFWHHLRNMIRKVFDENEKPELNDTLKEILLLFDILLLSFARSKDLIEEAPTDNPESLLDMLEYNWGTMLAGYLKERSSV